MAEPDALTLSGVAAGYTRHPVLADVGLSVAPGEIFGLVGLNGAGKTTLIKTVLDLVPAARGHIALFGEPHTRPGSRRHLAFLPEQVLPSPTLKGREWLRLILGHHGVRWRRAAADRTAEALALDPAALDRRVGTYSKGMGQKLGLIATFLSERPLLILDEPTRGLDPLARRRLKERIEAARAGGTTIVLSSHILADVDALCDRIGIVDSGGLAFAGAPGASERTDCVDRIAPHFPAGPSGTGHGYLWHGGHPCPGAGAGAGWFPGRPA